jgi:uncharacterized protein YutE (UPF0331/DUF86 family)
MAHFQTKEFEDLVDSLAKDLATSTSPRVIIPVCHIYLEYMISLIIKKKYEESETFLADYRNGFKNKIDLLNRLKILPEDEYTDLESINQIRNNFVHIFNPDLNDMAEKIYKLKFHIFNRNADPKTIIIHTILELMMRLEHRLLN